LPKIHGVAYYEVSGPSRVKVVAFSQIPLRYPAYDQLASKSATSSRADRRPASEQVSVMEYGLNRCATKFELSRHVHCPDSSNLSAAGRKPGLRPGLRPG